MMFTNCYAKKASVGLEQDCPNRPTLNIVPFLETTLFEV